MTALGGMPHGSRPRHRLGSVVRRSPVATLGEGGAGRADPSRQARLRPR